MFMNGITHKQAIELIHRRLDGLLNEKQLLSLEEHLRSCDSCRLYAAEMDLLLGRLQTQFHLRWDEQPGPSQKVIERVATKARNILMTNRISSTVRVCAGVAALVLTAFLANFVISQLQSASISGTRPNDNGTPISSLNPENRLLAFTSKQNGNFDIYTMHADGSGLTNLTNDPGRDTNPIWSPDGKRIAFESNRDGFIQIYLMDADGSNLIQFTNDKTDHGLYLNIDGKFNPWSRDGSKLLFLQSSKAGELSELYVQEITGENKILLARGSAQRTSWSPDGKYIGYVLNDSPNLETFVPGIYVIDPDGSNLRELKKLIPQDEYLKIPYYWSSDGQSIVFITDTNDPARQVIYPVPQSVYEFNLETNTLLYKDTLKPTVIDWGEETSLIMDAEQAGSAFVWQQSDGTSNSLDWDDSNCLFDITRSLQGNFAIGGYCPDSKKFKLYWANADGSMIKQLLDSPTLIGSFADITWSPDDQYVAFTLDSSLYILNVEDALNDSSVQPEQVVIAPYTIPSWQPIHILDVVENSPELKIDPHSCKPASELSSALRPPNELYGYDLVQGISFVDDDFSYEFWLYCDPSLKPDKNKLFNSVEGLGIYASWHYEGPRVEGANQYYFEFEPNVPLGTTSWDGPLYKASGTGSFGIVLPETRVRDSIQQGTPIQFRAVVDSPLGQNSAVLSFYLEPTDNGVRVVDLKASQPNNSYQGLIAFTSATENGNTDIYTIRADGSEMTNITNNPANDYSPLWSPDGERIGFISERNGNTGIFIMDPDSSNLTQLTDNPGYDGFFSWSPDGTKIAYLSSAGNDSNVSQLVIMNADGSNKTILTELGSYIFLGWSPSGQKIAYQKQFLETNGPQANEVHVVDIDGTNHYQWPAIIDAIKWTDEEHFVGYGWSGKSEPPSWILYRFSTNTNPAFEIASYSSPIVVFFENTYVVESGTILAWYSMDGNPTPVRSFRFNTQCSQPGDPYLQETGHYVSPDRAHAFVIVHCPEGPVWFYYENADGSEFKRLTDFAGELAYVGNQIWSPDEKYIIISITNQGNSKTDLYLFDIEKMLEDPSTEPIRLTTNDAMDYEAVWQPVP
jgi:Tol biopolymer transport system component